MKTTIEIADALLEEARRVAGREKTTLRNLVEQGLRRVLQDRRAHGSFKLKKATFKGQGLQAEFADAGWETIRGVSYGDRGGS
jgi:putative antitoxin of VapBC-like toxin-antitoxin system